MSAHLSQLVLGRLNRGMSNREHLPGFDSLSTDPYIVFVLLVPVLSHIRDPRDSSTTVLSAKDCSSRIQMEGTVCRIVGGRAGLVLASEGGRQA